MLIYFVTQYSKIDILIYIFSYFYTPLISWNYLTHVYGLLVMSYLLKNIIFISTYFSFFGQEKKIFIIIEEALQPSTSKLKKMAYKKLHPICNSLCYQKSSLKVASLAIKPSLAIQ